MLTLIACCAALGRFPVLLLRVPIPVEQAVKLNPVVFEGARLIIGDGSAPIDNGAFVVQDGHITAIGRKSELKAPAGAVHVDLTGKTVMPTLINVHVHIGYEGYTTWGAENYTPQNVLDHLEREAFYGIGVTQSVGSSPTGAAIQFQTGSGSRNVSAGVALLFHAGHGSA